MARSRDIPSAMREKKAPFQSMMRNICAARQFQAIPTFSCYIGGEGRSRTQLMPITRPLRFHISRYGGSRPTASRTDAMMPTTSIGVSFPAR